MEKSLIPFHIYLPIFLFLLLSEKPVTAQFDSTIWYNYYSNHSLSSRDNAFHADFNKDNELVITGRVENDFSNFDITSFVLNDNLDLVWKTNYSRRGQGISDDHPSDIAVDSSGNIFVAGFHTRYINSNIYYSYPVLYKMDNKGTVLWTYYFEDFKGYELDFEAYIVNIECDAQGNCFVLANGFQPGLSPDFKTFIIKFDPYGEIVWCKKTLLSVAAKMIIDNDQNIFVINSGDEDQNKNTIIQKYNNAGELVSEHRYYNYYVRLFDAKTDNKNTLWTFSDFSFGGLGDQKTCDILISHYDNNGSLIGEKIYDSQYHDYESLKHVSFYNDSTFLLGIDSKNPENGLDNLLIVVNNNLQIMDSIRYNSPWNNNDYLISCDMTRGRNIVMTGISFKNETEFYPYVLKIDNLKDIKWFQIPSISESISTYPEKILFDGDQYFYLIGDVRMSITPESGCFTHSNIFVTKFDTLGNEVINKEFSDQGKSWVVGKNVSLDHDENIYTSGIYQVGPITIYPYDFPNKGIVLQKYSKDGSVLWTYNIKRPEKNINYLNHFITDDTMITVVSGYPTKTGLTFLYSFNNDGDIVDSAYYDNEVCSAIEDNNYYYLFFMEDQNFTILKYNADLKIVRNASVPRFNSYHFRASFINGKIFLLSNDKNYLYILNPDLNVVSHIFLNNYFDYPQYVTADKSDNIYVAGWKTRGKVIKLKPSGEFVWSCEIDRLNDVDKGIDWLSTGDLVLYGSECSVGGCNPNGIGIVSQDGLLKKYTSTDCSIVGHKIDGNDFIYIFSNLNWVGGRNKYQKYSPNLDLLVNDYFNKGNNFGYTYDFYDIEFDTMNNIIAAGSVGYYLDYLNGMFSWYTLALTKIGKVNSHPVFINKNTAVKILPGDTAKINLQAIDYDNDSIVYKVITSESWFESNNIAGTYILKPSESDTGNYKIIVTASDMFNASDTSEINICVGNKAPYFTSPPIDTVILNNDYSYATSALDPDDEVVHFKIVEGPIWLIMSDSGVLYGRPAVESDTGCYHVRIICYDDFGGEGEQDFDLNVKSQNVTGVYDIINDDDIMIYPNPVSDIINIRLKKSYLRSIRVRIFKIDGSIVRDYHKRDLFNNELIQLDVSGLNNGIYILSVSLESVSIERKIIVL